MFQRFPSFIFYLLWIGLIAGWWTLTIEKNFTPSLLPITTQNISYTPSHFLEDLSIFPRESLKKALAGDPNLMIELIDLWQQDADTLRAQKIPMITSLTLETYHYAHVLKRLITNSSKENLIKFNRFLLKKMAKTPPFHSFLPQSYVAASFLLAISPTEEIVALPRGMHSLPQLYSSQQLNQIDHRIEDLSTEKLYLKNPDLAFVASYSNPLILSTLDHLRIPYHKLNFPNSLEDISLHLLQIGYASQHIAETQLLAIFLEACFKAIDNRLYALQHAFDRAQKQLSLLYLDVRQTFTLPAKTSLSSQCLSRALTICPSITRSISQKFDNWSQTIDDEILVQTNPDCLIFSVFLSNQPPSIPFCSSAFKQLKAVKTNKVFYLDEAIQNSPTQYVALAYFDLYQTLVMAYLS